MSQFGSFEQTQRSDLIEHLEQIVSLRNHKLEELRSIDALIDTLNDVIGVHALQGSGVELSSVA